MLHGDPRILKLVSAKKRCKTCHPYPRSLILTGKQFGTKILPELGKTKLIDLTQALVSTLGISNSVERRRVNVMVQAYMLYIKLLSEDVKLGFPESLSRLDGASYMQGQNHIKLLQKAMETFRASLKSKVKEMIGAKWEALNDH